MQTNTEPIRKGIHMAAGLGPPLGVFLVGWIGTLIALTFVLVYVLAGAILLRQGIRLSFIAAFFHLASRKHETFPIEPLTFVGVFIGLALLFHEPVFFSAVAVLAVGDGVATIAGIRWGRRRLPWNARKSYVGLVAGILAAAIAAPAFAWLGVWFHERGYEDAPLIAESPFLLVLIGGAAFVLLMGIARLVLLRRPASRVSNAAPLLTALVLMGALAASGAPLLLERVGVDGPFLAYDDGAPVALFVTSAVAASFAMLVESFIRRYDNLLVPLAYVVPILLLRIV